MENKPDEKNLKRQTEESPRRETKTASRPEDADDSAWANDQKNRSYYYDDAHGYEIYDPEKDEEEEED